VQRQVLVELSGDHFITDVADHIGFPSGQPADIDVGGRLLDVSVGVIDLLGHPVTTDAEVDQRPLRLRAPISVSRDIDRSHRIGLAPRDLQVADHVQSPACMRNSMVSAEPSASRP